MLSLAAPSAFGATATFNTPGTFEWVCPPGVTSIQVECWGGGGAGGAGRKDNNTGTNTSQNGAGGGGGAYARRAAVPVTPGISYQIIIPAAAVSGTNGTQTQNGGAVNGGTVIFTGDSDVMVQAAGGNGGPNSYVTGANAVQGTTSGGAGGTVAASIGDPGAVFAGGAGFRGTLGAQSSQDNSSGGGGGGAGNAAAGASAVTGGTGAAGGIAGGGPGGNGRIGANTNFGAGSPGLNPGGGGGGGKNGGQNTRLGGTGGLGQIVITYTGPEVVKANNTDDLTLTTSWVGGVVPTTNDRAKWDSTVTAANTTSLGGDLTIGGIVITDPAGPVTINSGSTLTLGNEVVDIDLSAATQDLTLNCDLAMGAPNIWDIATGRTLTLDGTVSGAGVTIQGSGTTLLQGANTWAGGMATNGGTVKLAANEVIPHGTGTGNVTLNGTLDLNGFSEQINGLSGAGIVDNTAAGTTSVFTIGNINQAGIFSGAFQNSGASASLEVVKTGTGALTLSGASTHSGLTTINGGAVTIQNAGALGTTAAGTIVNGTIAGNAQNARLDLSGGITVTGEPITISGVGNFNGALGSANGSNEWAGNVTISAPGTRLGAVAGATLKVSGVVDSGAEPHGLVIRTANITESTVILTNANTYLGDTWVAVGKLQLEGGNNRLPVATRMSMGATTNISEFDLNGTNQELAGLTLNAGATGANNAVNNSSVTLSTLTLNTVAAPSTFAGILKGNLTLTKAGANTLTLAGVNTYTGPTQVAAGTLLLSTAGSGVSDISVSSGATLGVLVVATDGRFFNLGDLSLGSNSVLSMDYGTTSPSTTVAPVDVDDFTVGTGLSLVVKGTNLAALTPGQSYPLVTWVGNGPVDGTSFTTVLNPRLQGTFSVVGKTLLFTVTANTQGSPISWNTGNGTWDTATANWIDGNLASTTFFDTFDAVLFGDATGVVGNPVVALDTPVSPTAVVMNSTARSYTLSGTGGIGGNASLTLDAANTGTLTLTTANSFTGATVVNGGTLQLGNGGTEGALAQTGPISIGTGATLVVNQSDTVTQGIDLGAAAITGAGNLAQTGTGTTILTAANTYSGQTTVSAGTLQANVATGANSLGTSAVAIAAGTTVVLENTNTTSGSTLNLGNTFSGTGELIVRLAANTNPRNLQMPNLTGFEGSIRLSSLGATGDKWNTAGFGASLSSVIVEPGNSLYIPNGTPSFAGGITLSGAGNTEGRGAIRLSNATLGGNITLAGDTTINLDNAAAVLSGDITSGAEGTQTLTLGATASTGGTLSGVIGGGTGTLSVVTAVGGNHTLNNANTYTGGTSLNAGTINVNHSNALGTGTAAINGGIRFVLGNEVNVPNSFVLGPNAGAVGFGLIQVNTGNTATISGPITINNGAAAGGHFATAGTGVLHLAGEITSSVNVTHRIGTTIFSGGGTGYTSLTNGQGTVLLGADNGIATTATMSIGNSGAAIFDLAGFSQTLVGLIKGAQAATIGNSSATSDSTLTTTGTSTFAGVITDGIGGGTMKTRLTVASGQLTLSGANTYTGDTTITGGTLALGGSDRLPNSSPVSIGTGTLDAATFTDLLGTLDVTAAATVNLGEGAVLEFDDSSAIDWTDGTLAITGTFVSGASIRFGTTASGLTATQLGRVSASGFTEFALDANGFLTATQAGYSAWAAINAGGQAANLDFDNDGIPNGVEFFMNAATGFTANPQLGVGSTITWPNGGNLPASAYGTQFVVQTSPDLATWTDVPVGDLTANTDGPAGALTYTLTGAAPRFVRLKVTPN